MFEAEFEKFVALQRKSASGQRLEMLNRDLYGTKKMLEVTVWPVLGTFEGVILEYPFVGPGGAKYYIDAYLVLFALGLESEGFVTHAETISRDRFAKNKKRIRICAKYGYTYFPFSSDELEKNPDECRRDFQEYLASRTITHGRAIEHLTVDERETLRFGMRLFRPLKLDDVKYCLQCGYHRASNVVQSLVAKKMLTPVGNGVLRIHQFEVTPLATQYLSA